MENPNYEQNVMPSKSGKIEVMINDKADEVIEELFQLRLSRYQIEYETSTKGGDFISDCAHLLYCKWHKTDFK